MKTCGECAYMLHWKLKDYKGGGWCRNNTWGECDDGGEMGRIDEGNPACPAFDRRIPGNSKRIAKRRKVSFPNPPPKGQSERRDTNTSRRALDRRKEQSD